MKLFVNAMLVILALQVNAQISKTAGPPAPPQADLPVARQMDSLPAAGNVSSSPSATGGSFVATERSNKPVQEIKEVDEEEAEPALVPASGAGQTAVTNQLAPQTNVGPDVAAAPGVETNAAPVKDPAKCIIARFGFDGTFQPDVGGGATIPVTFKRESAAYLESAPVNADAPRFVEGRFGRALLLESAYDNLFSIAQANAAEATAFIPLAGAALSISSDQFWQGKESLAVATKGENSEEGFSVEAAVEKALYTKETSPAIAPAFYVVSLYLKGQGNVKLTLKDVASGASGETVYAELSDNWQRFSCGFGYSFNRINIGANHEADWKKFLPAETNLDTKLDAKLQLVCTTVDSQKLNLFADGLQLEKRCLASGKKAEFSPHSWVLGAFQTSQEQFAVDVKNDYFNTWEKTGSVAFWFKPMWEARDGSGEIILQIAKNQFNLSHNNQKIILAPAGISFTPYDWKDNWHHIVISWNEAGERILYVDGLDYPNTSGEMRPLKDAESIMAGDFARNLSPNGAIDDLILYNITLNPEQVKALAAAAPAEKNVATTIPGQSPAPVANVTPDQMPAPKPANAPATPDEEAEEE